MAYPALLFVHGAANAAWIWDAWRRQLRPFGWEANVLDLRGHGRSLPVDFTTVTMDNYVEDVESVTAQIATQSRAPVLAGWGMGGLVAMMYAMKHPETPALMLLSPSPPAEVADRASPVERRRTPPGAYGPELYGIDPSDPASARAAQPDLSDAEAAQAIASLTGALESGVARHQRLRGVSVPAGAITCPVLVIHGEEDAYFPPDLNEKLAYDLNADRFVVPEAGHWGIVYHESAVAAAAMHASGWLRRVLTP